MSLRKISLAFCGIVSLLAGVSSAGTVKPVDVSQVQVGVDEVANLIEVSLTYNLKDYKLGRNEEVILIPAIISDSAQDSLLMNSVTICGRNRWYWYLRNGKADNLNSGIYRAGSNEAVTVSGIVPFEEWMHHSTVEVIMKEASCCSTPKRVEGQSEKGNTLIATINTGRQAMDFDYIFAPTMSDAPVVRTIEGSAFVNFVVNRTELNPDYMLNRQELAKIINSIDFVKKDKDAIITNVHIKGFASPEGSYANNTRLAQGRTETLANYVNDLYKFQPGIMSTSYDPEDWEGLRRYIADSLNYDIQNRSEILGIIDGQLGFDAKDQALKTRFPKDYQVILKEIYPWLRHSDYKVEYNIKVYTDINELKRLYKEDPFKLRPVDFNKLALQYPETSKDYADIMRKALEVYPNDNMINLNVANLDMMDGNYEAAQSCLLKAGNTPQANFARGVLAAKLGEWEEAEKYFTIADKEGIPQAEVYLKQVNAQKTYNPVTIDINK